MAWYNPELNKFENAQIIDIKTVEEENMDTEIVKTENGKDYNRFGEEIITCIICNKEKTTMLGTKKCDICWELESRISSNFELAKKIIADLESE